MIKERKEFILLFPKAEYLKQFMEMYIEEVTVTFWFESRVFSLKITLSPNVFVMFSTESKFIFSFITLILND